MPLNSANYKSKQCLVDCRTNEYINKNFWRTRTSALNALHSLLVIIRSNAPLNIAYPGIRLNNGKKHILTEWQCFGIFLIINVFIMQ